MAVPKQKPLDFTPDPQQKLALEHTIGPMLVIAGAGTGKTSVLTQRFARLIEQGHAQAEEILALTYTQNSAAEMKKRVQLASPSAKNAQAYTFHDYCFDILKRHNRGFEVLDDYDLNILLRKRIRSLNLKHYVRAAKVGQFLKDLLEFMRRCQDELVTSAQYRKYIETLVLQNTTRGEVKIHRVAKSKDSDELTEEEVLARCQEIAGVFETVEAWLSDESLGTFGHMITRALRLLESDPEVLRREQARARFILADEFQDVNFAQIRVLSLLAGKDANLFAVGDPDQAIYRFRGASSGAFDIFLRQYPETKIVRLERNRRSLSPILHCAHAIIQENPPIFRHAALPGIPNHRHVLVSVREEDAKSAAAPLRADPVEIIAAKKDRESEDVAATIAARKRSLGGRWRDFAVLYRQHSHREEVMDQLSSAGIPFAVETMDVLDTPQVRDLLACVGAVVDPADSISLFRVAALPEFAIDPLALQSVMRSAARETDLHHVLDDVTGGPAVLAKLNQVRAEIAQKSSKGVQALRIILHRFNLAADNLATQAFLEFVAAWERKKPPIKETGELGELLEYLKLFREAEGKVPAKPPDQRDAVQLMSAHTAKGLEFRHVFVIRIGSNSFPASYRESLVEFPQELRDPQSVAPGDSKELNCEEERRLFYVAMTRAEDTLTLYGSPGRGKKDPTPPGYLRDLLTAKSLTQWLRPREPQPVQIDLLAAAEDLDFAAASPSPVSAWIALPLPPPPQRGLSASAIESYERCPLQFKLNRDWRIPEESHAALQYGGAMHLALRHYFDAVRFERPATVADVIQIFHDEFAKAVIPDAYQRELYEQQGERQLQDFIAAAERNLPAVLHTEQEFAIELAGSKIRGRIDRIDRLDDGTVRIVDYKTGKAKTQDDADESLQLSIYALAAQQKWGYHASALALQNLQDGSMPITRRNELDLRKVSDRVEKVASEITEGRFDPKPGRHCSWCGFRNLCPVTEKNLAILQRPVSIKH
jgi:DNA helicase-2/ATP-dependent DNA helicase PcrA